MQYQIKEIDKQLLLANQIKYKYRLWIVQVVKAENGGYILTTKDMVEGISGFGEYSISAESDVRRTSSFTLYLDDTYKDKSLEDKISLWMGYDFLFQIGVYNYRSDNYIWYDCGYYAITGANLSYSATDNSLNVDLSDWIAKLDGTRNGTLGGAPTIEIPVLTEIEEDDPDYVEPTGDDEIDFENKYRVTIIKDAVVTWINECTATINYIVDDIGEYKAFPENNTDWERYRKEHPEWNQLPYDLEFDGSDSLYTILKQIVDLYPNYQCYFDTYANLCINMFASKDSDPIVLNDEYIQDIILADNTETVQYDIPSIHNVTEVYGKCYDIDRYSTDVKTETESGNTCYTLFLENYEGYESHQMIAFVASSDNTGKMYVRVETIEKDEEGEDITVKYSLLPLVEEGTIKYVDVNTLTKDNTYVFKIRKNVDSDSQDEYKYVANFLGQYQPHAICVLSDDPNEKHYTKEYFAEKYNCKLSNITIRIEDSPFSVQKIGESIEFDGDGDFENILSDTVAVENSIYYNKKSTSFNDVVTIKTKMIPWLDVNQKVSYRRQQEQEAQEYIIKSIVNDLEGMTSTITMYHFYPLYYLE